MYLFSFVNPEHERRTRELILEEFPDVEHISLSHEVMPRGAFLIRPGTVDIETGEPIPTKGLSLGPNDRQALLDATRARLAEMLGQPATAEVPDAGAVGDVGNLD